MRKAERKRRQQAYNRTSRERRSRRRMMLEHSASMLDTPAPQEANYGAILMQLAAAGDRDAQRLFAICVDVAESGTDPERGAVAVEMIAAAHDY